MEKSEYKITDWLPTTLKEVKQRGWDELDVILFTGDAYVDHPSFGAAVIGRVLESEGLKVAIVPQPNWEDDLRDFKKLGKPRLFFGVTSGNMDSMVNHYTANKRLRSDDAYTPGGKAGFRPDYATVVYTKILKEIFPEVPVIIGGIEASLRRLTHFDYWSEKLKPSILYESGADMLFYGNAEKAIIELVRLMQKNTPIPKLQNISQTAIMIAVSEKTADNSLETCPLNSHEDCLVDKIKFAKNFKLIEIESNKFYAKRIIQNVYDKVIIVNPPYPQVSEKETDKYYELPYTRLPHPKYNKRGNIPAYEMIKFSLNIHRGCFGGCSFCTISAHQGKFIVSRSQKSVLRELEEVVKLPDFKGHITDIGGPSANMYRMKGKDLSICEMCERPSCINPTICKNLDTDHNPLINLYSRIRNHPKVKKASIGSGIRYDLLFDKNMEITGDKLGYVKDLLKYHVSGRLKVAPEHTSDAVLKVMRKPSFKLFYKFKEIFDKINKEENLNQQLIPYFISSHPGSTDEDMADLACKTKDLNFHLEQIQDFTPTPMTVSEVIYYSGVHPYTMEKIYTAKTKDEKLNQRMFFFWYKKEFKQQIMNKLKAMKRPDFIAKLFGQK
jgi:uncharacterized radical SAM protein YgiQ